jgi:general secretion pathway protein G
VLQRLRAARHNDKGFTLVELLIVIVILGVLAGIVVFAVNGITDRGVTAACKADIQTVQTASEAYYAEYGYYAPGYNSAVVGGVTHVGLVPGFLKAPPNPGGNKYTITYNADGSVSGTTGGSAC